MIIPMRVVAFVLPFSVFASHAYAAGDAAQGETLSEEICSRCHNVEPGAPFKEFPPSFASIAVYRAAEDIRWKIIAPPLHTGMPQFYLTPDEIQHIIAYIISLEEE